MVQARKEFSRLGHYRLSSGSVIAEGVAGSCLIILIGVALFVFFANVAAQLSLQAQVAAVADQTAEAVDAYRHWLGQPRPGFTEEMGSQRADSIANELCQRLGLGTATVTVSYQDTESLDCTRCLVNINAVARIPFRLAFFGFNFAGLFPGNVTAVGTASQAKVQPYAIVQMDAPSHSTQTARDVAVMPAYGFFYNATGADGVIGTAYGNGIADNLTPENSFSLNHYHLKREDVEYVQTTGNDSTINAWNKTRLINGQTQVVE
jgi:hypothetical protein